MKTQRDHNVVQTSEIIELRPFFGEEFYRILTEEMDAQEELTNLNRSYKLYLTANNNKKREKALEKMSNSLRGILDKIMYYRTDDGWENREYADEANKLHRLAFRAYHQFQSVGW